MKIINSLCRTLCALYVLVYISEQSSKRFIITVYSALLLFFSFLILSPISAHSMSSGCCCFGRDKKQPLSQQECRENSSYLSLVESHTLVADAIAILSRSDHEGLRMGFEIETSCFKVDAKGAERIGFTIKSEAGNFSWQIENDTQDKSVKQNQPQDLFNSNLELQYDV